MLRYGQFYGPGTWFARDGFHVNSTGAAVEFRATATTQGLAFDEAGRSVPATLPVKLLGTGNDCDL